MPFPDARPPDRQDTTDTEMTFDSLPNELVSIIFTHMYEMLGEEEGFRKLFVEPGMDEDCDRDVTWKDENAVDPGYLFPKAIAAVCQRWREIVERLPILWTRIVAFVDSSPTPLSEVEAYLKLSRDLPLQVYVLTRPDHDLEEDWGERTRCRDVIELLVPHIPRCQKIAFDVMYSSSLPSISKDFLGCAPLLQMLNLKCETDDGVASGGQDPRSEIAEEPFLTPALKDLCVDGRNFVHASLALPSWIESIPKGQIRLRVHNFAASDSISEDLEFNLHDFILVLERLKVVRLSLSNVKFSDHSTVVPNASVSADTLELERLNYHTFTGIMAFIADGGIESIRISQCGIAFLGRDLHSDCLILEGISAGADISDFLVCWSGGELKVSNCPGFDDIALETLGNMDNARIRSLIIEDCQNISLEGVMEMAQRLNEWVALQRRDGCLDREKCALNNLSILGHPHVLTPAEELWFRQNASSGEFVWTARK
ncbi:hypothetical protein Hypma_011146 [Hypsizygus marmoreus]|uniref:Uncharacterized protein n=1 Tax=Hypsizygus marmoreus TaxID=39966 RepID=A0A369JQU6_HYPMA|nr:hypothetical protein Hypma_011146 [Hypsizygus marmoreus]